MIMQLKSCLATRKPAHVAAPPLAQAQALLCQLLCQLKAWQVAHHICWWPMDPDHWVKRLGADVQIPRPSPLYKGQTSAQGALVVLMHQAPL